MFKGATPIVEEMSCHVSVLSPGHSPHPPHAHEEEELLIALQGEAELIISDSPSTDYARTEKLSPGSFIYYPAGQHHTIRNSSTSPITYLMFKWRREELTGGTAAGTHVFHFGTVPMDLEVVPGTPHSRTIHRLSRKAACAFNDDATRCRLRAASGCLRCGHRSAVRASRDLGRNRAAAWCDLLFGGQHHGVRNVGEQPAQYLVFEFHAPIMSSSTRARLRRRQPASARSSYLAPWPS